MTVYKQALSGKISFPSHVSRFSRHLISQFLQTAPSKRIGNLRGGVADVKGHPFFKDFDWVALETRQTVCGVFVCSTLYCHLSLMRFHQQCPLQFETVNNKDTQHYGQVRFPGHSFSVGLTVWQYEESEAEFPGGELSPSQQQIFNGF